jgi:tripartite-type tricarboxylate transporter receptor subunit TctC
VIDVVDAVREAWNERHGISWRFSGGGSIVTRVATWGIFIKAFALALPDLLAGRITVMMNNLPAQVDPIRSGKLRGLGVTTLKRSPRLPEIPTIDESGVPGFEVMVWYGVMAPAAVPVPILNKLHADTLKALGMADLRLRLEQQGVDPGSSATREEFAALVRSETVKWAKVVRDANIPSQ